MSKSRHKKKAAKQIAPVQPNQCIAMIPKGKIVCGDMTAFTIETNKNCGKDLFRVNIDPEPEGKCIIFDKNNGSYEVSWVPSKTAVYTIDVTVLNSSKYHSVKNSPYSADIEVHDMYRYIAELMYENASLLRKLFKSHIKAETTGSVDTDTFKDVLNEANLGVSKNESLYLVKIGLTMLDDTGGVPWEAFLDNYMVVPRYLLLKAKKKGKNTQSLDNWLEGIEPVKPLLDFCHQEHERLMMHLEEHHPDGMISSNQFVQEIEALKGPPVELDYLMALFVTCDMDPDEEAPFDYNNFMGNICLVDMQRLRNDEKGLENPEMYGKAVVSSNADKVAEAMKKLKQYVADHDEAILHMCKTEFDVNGDGFISRAEFRRLVAKCRMDLTSWECNALVNTIDLNGDGHLPYEEILALGDGVPKTPKPEPVEGEEEGEEGAGAK